MILIVGGVIALFVLVGIMGNSCDSTPTQQKSESTAKTEQVNLADKQAAQKELDELMGLAKESGLVMSYDFTPDKGWTVYVGSVWYSQTVQFKKDFLAKIATLRKRITGYTFFEIRDAFSNEKVAEVTAFSSSLEVYK